MAKDYSIYTGSKPSKDYSIYTGKTPTDIPKPKKDEIIKPKKATEPKKAKKPKKVKKPVQIEHYESKNMIKVRKHGVSNRWLETEFQKEMDSQRRK